MNSDTIKSNLRNYYNQEAEHRNASDKDGWKAKERKAFSDMAAQENKKHLLEIGAGSGQDSQYFMEQGFDVTAVDLSKEMVQKCKEKGINAHELDFYNLAALNQKFDCIWAMNTLLHVPKADLQDVLRNISAVLNQNGIFFMGVYGGKDSEHEWANDICDIPRFFSFYSPDKLKAVLQDVFEIISFKQYDVGRTNEFPFQAAVMRKR